MTTVDIQFSPAATDWPTLRTAAREAEARGYGAVHALDHLAGLPLGGYTMIDPFTLLGAIAEATSTIELGTMVANAWNRQAGSLVTAVGGLANLSGRRVHFGVGAGSAPGTRWAFEHEAVGAHLEPVMAARHVRVREVLELCASQWRDDRDEVFATFPLPSPRPSVIVGANSVALCRLAAESADGVCLQWQHPRRREFVETIDALVGDRQFVKVAYTTYSPDLLDPAHPMREEMAACGVDRLVLPVFDGLASWLADSGAPRPQSV